MNKQTEDSKIKKDEVISDECTELNEDALEQVSGGVDTLKTKSETLLRENVTLNFSKVQVEYKE